ncbi:ATP-binding cassette domain-containing protein [Christiangramia forsetii]|uniref:ABC-type transporter ATP-binding protein n=2 Tax=Christiangramia forsetii TaxID=411153 RepID=A0LYL2_CHRFK|nr:ABC transporter ATP-binding protein [Christiangramia forsetii]GGG33916.1 ABC transporter ATP-binding protein [Christiangramia forsetii]CAL65457.1 ABC-type transporter ATP-binding protein [Christiangramia forsetii KT0803]
MIFELDNVELSYKDKQILYGIYLKAETGKITGILGSNGCGKTSLLKIFFGNLACTNKLIRIDKKATLKKLYSIKKVKLLSQTDFLPNTIKLSKLFRIYGVSWQSIVEKFPSFKKYHNYTLAQLSGGERRLIAIWLSIKSEGDLVLLDEPFTHLTPLYIEIIKKELLLEKENKAIIITDHLYNDLIEITDTLYFIKDGCSRFIEDSSELQQLGYISL